MNEETTGVSRRDALRLAKLGALLGAGLCVVRDAEADPPGGAGVLQQKVRGESMFTVKLYVARDEKPAELLQTINIPDEAAKNILATPGSVAQVKFWRPAGDGSVKPLFAQTVQVKLRRE